MVGAYYHIAKPERTFTNVITAVAGYLFASQWHIKWTFLALITGITLVIASASVVNNYTDRRLDQKMERTKKRALVTGATSARSALIYASAIGIIGFWLLFYTNQLTLAVIAIGYIGYVVFYGAAKRTTSQSTLIGTIPGGASLVAGYTAVTGRFDAAAVILFLIMVGWQVTHFYAIAIYRRKDYAAAGIPVISVKKGVGTTKLHMWFYLLLFIISAASLTFAGYTGYIYLAGVALLGFLWLHKALQGFKTQDNEAWARSMFKFSLSALIIMMVLISIGPTLP